MLKKRQREKEEGRVGASGGHGGIGCAGGREEEGWDVQGGRRGRGHRYGKGWEE